MFLKSVGYCSMIILITFLQYQRSVSHALKTDEKTPLYGIVIFRTRYCGREFFLVKKGIEWRFINDPINGTENAYDIALKMLEEHIGVKKDDIIEIKNYKKISKPEVKPEENTATYWFAEVIDPNIDLKLLSTKFSRKRWETFVAIEKFASSNVVETIKAFEEHMKQIKYVSHIYKTDAPVNASSATTIVSTATTTTANITVTPAANADTPKIVNTTAVN